MRYHHTAAVRVALMDKIAPPPAVKMLSALYRVLKEAYKLDLMDANQYIKAVDWFSVYVQR